MPRDSDLRDALIDELLVQSGAQSEERGKTGGEERRPSEEELIAYLEGALSPEAEERLQDLFARSPDEAARLLALAELLAAETPAGLAQSPAVTEGLRDLAARLESGGEVVRFGRVRRGRLGMWVSLGSAAAALAASLAFLVVGTSASRMGVVVDARPPQSAGVPRGEDGAGSSPSVGRGALVQLSAGSTRTVVLGDGEALYFELPAAVESGVCEASIHLPDERRERVNLRARGYLAFLAVERPVAGLYRIWMSCGAERDAFAARVEGPGSG